MRAGKVRHVRRTEQAGAETQYPRTGDLSMCMA